MSNAIEIRGAEVIALADEAYLAREAAWRLVEVLNRAVELHGEAHIALTGGSSAVVLYRELVQPVWREQVPWTRVHLWWGDERLVPVDHPESNAGLAYRVLLAIGARTAESGDGAQAVDIEDGAVAGLPIPAQNVHPVETQPRLREPESATLIAERYAADIVAALPIGAAGLPAFDVILLGVGGDGHIMSVFPASPLINDDDAIVAAVPAPAHSEPRLPRVTLTPRLLPAAGLVLVMVSGSDKARILTDVLGSEHNPSRWPAQLALLPNAVWLLDREAAAALGGRPAARGQGR